MGKGWMMYLDWVLSGLTILMNVMLTNKNKWAWVLMIFLSILWIVYAFTLTPVQYGLLPATVANLFIAVRGAVKWFKEDNDD
jgi:hypothetical protein